jgi:hypothetical protein
MYTELTLISTMSVREIVIHCHPQMYPDDVDVGRVGCMLVA